MSGELGNMKELSKAVVERIDITVLSLVFNVQYKIVDQAGDTMYSEKYSRDMSKVPNIGDYTLAQMKAWAVGEAVKDAVAKYGKS